MTTFLLVHGAFCGGWVWSDTASALQERGHRAHTVDLPSSGAVASELGDLRADLTVVRQALDGLDGDVVLVGHSGAGAPLVELADHRAVRHSIFIAALHPSRGQSVADMLGGQVPDWTVLRDDGAVQVSERLEVARQALCADVDAERFARDVYPRYLLTSMSSLATASTAPDRTHPATYVVCEHDHVVPVEAQEAMAGSLDGVERLPSSHSPMLSMPGRLAEVLERAGARS